jgi:aminopeptidase N
MDESWATMTEFLFHPLIASDVKFTYDISAVNDYAGLAEDVPIMTPTAQLYGKARFADKDLKPALALFYLKEMLGEKLFTDAMRSYISTWAGKHPTPYDFFNCMNAGAKTDLNWYWKKWYFEKAIPDLAIGSVISKASSYEINILNKGGAPVPLHINLCLKNGKTIVITKTAGIWKDGKNRVTISLKTHPEIEKITLGDSLDADINSSDNTWVSK